MKNNGSILRRRHGFAGLVVAVVLSLAVVPPAWSVDPLPSWHDRATKRAITEFVRAVTDPDSESFVKPEERLATFDNDGTLWCEKPMYIHLFANFERFKQLMVADPELKSRQPYRAVARKDMSYFLDLFEASAFDTVVSDLFAVPFGGMTVSAFEQWNKQWLESWKHPKFKVGYRGLIYQPMVELIRYLEANDFTVHILTADEAAFLRLVAEEMYGLPPERVHGSSVRLAYVVENGRPELVRTHQAHYLDNWDGKPRLIEQTLGRKPILAAGNSNGDLHMLQYTAGGGGLALLLHHTDGAREYQYDKHTDKVVPLAQKEGWTVIDMKADWRSVFPPPGQ